jgi:hypothetical protein
LVHRAEFFKVLQILAKQGIGRVHILDSGSYPIDLWIESEKWWLGSRQIIEKTIMLPVFWNPIAGSELHLVVEYK